MHETKAQEWAAGEVTQASQSGIHRRIRASSRALGGATLLSSALLLSSGTAAAAGKLGGSASAGSSTAGSSTKSSDLDEDDAAPVNQGTSAASSSPSSDPPAGKTSDAPEGEDAAALPPAEEEPTGVQYLLGARYRMMVVPKFLINAFGVEGGTDIVVHGVGPEFGVSSKNFELIFSPWYADYGMKPTPFKGPNDPEEAWELIESKLKVIYLSLDLDWKMPVSKTVSVFLGTGLGVGIVTGKLYRDETYWTSGASLATPGDPYTQLAKCGNVGGPNGAYANDCLAGGNYSSATNPMTAATAWPVYPWLNFQTGLRWQPTRHFVGRLDLGLGSSGFWFGLGADYGT